MLYSPAFPEGVHTAGQRDKLGGVHCPSVHPCVEKRGMRETAEAASGRGSDCHRLHKQVEGRARGMAAPVLVPDSISRNGEIFRNSPRRENPSKTTSRYVEGMVEQQRRAAGGGAAMARADLSEDDGLGSIDPPALLPPASYYQDVRNHANIASTMLVSARRTVGFEPSLVGQELSGQQMDDFIFKFYDWIFELDNYWPYLDSTRRQFTPLQSDEDVSRFIASFGGLRAEVTQAWRQSLSGMVRAASSATSILQGGIGKGVSFQTDILDTSGSRDPMLPLTFGLSVLGVVFTFGATYLVNSSAIIADADYLARNGVAIFGAREYRDYVNSGGR